MRRSFVNSSGVKPSETREDSSAVRRSSSDLVMVAFCSEGVEILPARVAAWIGGNPRPGLIV